MVREWRRQPKRENERVGRQGERGRVRERTRGSDGRCGDGTPLPAAQPD